jgi:hypothetical protein
MSFFFLSNYLSLLRKDIEDKIQVFFFITVVINQCCFKINLLIHLDNILHVY